MIPQNESGYDLFLMLAIFSTYISIENLEKNSKQQENQTAIQDRLDRILEELTKIREGGERFDTD